MRRLAIAVGVPLLTLVLAGPVLAARPVGRCGNEGFDLMTYSQFRALSVSVGVPEELLGPEHLAQWNSINKNDDKYLCVKDLPDTPGHLGGWIFNVVDNTARVK